MEIQVPRCYQIPGVTLWPSRVDYVLPTRALLFLFRDSVAIQSVMALNTDHPASQRLGLQGYTIMLINQYFFKKALCVVCLYSCVGVQEDACAGQRTTSHVDPGHPPRGRVSHLLLGMPGCICQGGGWGCESQEILLSLIPHHCVSTGITDMCPWLVLWALEI